MGLLGKFTDAIGLTDHAGAEAARAQSAAAQAESAALTKEQIAFQREQYEDWKGIYGPLQEDLGTYFKNITGNTIAAEQLTQIQRESQAAQQQIDQQFAQRGLGGSGLEAAALTQNIFGTAQQKAQVRASADEQAMNKKMGFLGLGMGQGSNMLGNINQAYGQGAGNLMNISSSLGQQATSISNANMSTMGTLIGAGTMMYGGSQGWFKG